MGLAAKIQKRWISWGVLAVFASSLFWMSRYYALEITITQSVPYHLFWLKKGVLPQKNEWVSFMAPQNGVYPHKTVFTKQLVGVAGDVVRIKGREFFLNGKFMAFAKTHRTTGEPLALGPSGVIPSKHYFVHGPHQDSFDSRYQNMGWINENQILGTAVPLL